MAAILSTFSPHFHLLVGTNLRNKSPVHLQTSVLWRMSQSCIRSEFEIHFSLLRPFEERWLSGCAVWLCVSKQLGDMIICSASLTKCTLLPASVRGFSEALLWCIVWTIRTLWAPSPSRALSQDGASCQSKVKLEYWSNPSGQNSVRHGLVPVA